MGSGGVIWLGVLLSAIVTSIGEAVPYESLPRRIAWLVGSALLYAYLLDLNYTSTRPVVLISVVIVWTVVNALGTLCLYIYFNKEAVSHLTPFGYGVLGLTVAFGVVTVILANWAIKLLEEAR